MKEEDLVRELDLFAGRIEAGIKGLTSEISWIIYGSEKDYHLDLSKRPSVTAKEGGESPPGWEITEKSARAWEAYCLYNSAGVLQGHITGRPESGTRGTYTGRLEEDSSRQFIHQLLPEEYSLVLKNSLIEEPGLKARMALLLKYPALASAELFFNAYLKSIYRGVAGGDREVLVSAMKDLPGGSSLEEYFAESSKVDEILEGERRTAIYHLDKGAIRVYDGTNKRTRRCINAWVFGEEMGPRGVADGHSGEEPSESDYEETIRFSNTKARIDAMVLEASRLMNDDNAREVIEVVAAERSGRLSSIFEQIDSMADIRDWSAVPPEKVALCRSLLEQGERYYAVISRKGRILEKIGIDAGRLKELGSAVLKLRRRLP